MTCFSSSSAFWVSVLAFFSGKPESSPQGWWVKMSLFSDIWVITMKYAEPMNTHTHRTVVNLIWILIVSNSSEFLLMSTVRHVKVPLKWSYGLCWTVFHKQFHCSHWSSPVVSDPLLNFSWISHIWWIGLVANLCAAVREGRICFSSFEFYQKLLSVETCQDQELLWAKSRF